VKEYYWNISNNIPKFLLPKVEEKLDEGVTFKVIYPKDMLLKMQPTLSQKIRNEIEYRVLDEIKLLLNANDSHGFSSLPGRTGQLIDIRPSLAMMLNFENGASNFSHTIGKKLFRIDYKR
jgi:hypothetical protein